MKGSGKGRDAVPVTIRQKTYASMAEAAKALGVTRAAVLKARQRGTLDSVGIRTKRGEAPKDRSYREPWSPTLPWETT